MEKTMNSNPNSTAPIALITGASRGLGKSAALHLAQQGVDVIVTYQKQQGDAQAVVAEIQKLGRKAVALQLDVADASRFTDFAHQVKTALSGTWQRTAFNYLVNNAGSGEYANFMDTTEQQFDSMVNIHLKSVFFLSQKLLPLLADGGKILNITTGLTRFSFPGYAAYGTAKGGVEVLTQFMAKELADRKITVNAIAPGGVETDFGGGAVRDNPELNAMLASMTALGRVGLPADIGTLVAGMLVSTGGWVNGQRIEASGGIFL
jgi:NAD(P)-dependent dehydrogenase (short-subunit alcohol dehydrogenase family)